VQAWEYTHFRSNHFVHVCVLRYNAEEHECERECVSRCAGPCCVIFAQGTCYVSLVTAMFLTLDTGKQGRAVNARNRFCTRANPTPSKDQKKWVMPKLLPAGLNFLHSSSYWKLRHTTQNAQNQNASFSNPSRPKIEKNGSCQNCAFSCLQARNLLLA